MGNDDGGKAMSEQEFEEYKASKREARANRLYVNWRNMETGADCKAIGPSSQCFCGHRYKEHNFDNVTNKKVNCKDKTCKCRLFSYIPVCKYLYNIAITSFAVYSRFTRLQVHGLQTFVPRAQLRDVEMHAWQLQVR